MRAALLLAVLLAPGLGGCLAEDAAPLAGPGLVAVRGLVTDALLAPVAGARVTLLATNATTTTADDGTFLFPAVAGEAALVHAEAPGFEPATRRVGLDGRDGFVRIALDALPSAEPYTVPIELVGFVSCAAMLRVGGEGAEGTVVSCGEDDPNDQRDLEFEVPLEEGVAGVVLELVWEPGTSLASRFHFTAAAVVDGATVDLGRAEGGSYVKLTIPRSVAREVLGPGVVVRTRTEPAPSLLDEEAFLGAGAAVAQPFTVFATVFYHAPPPPAYRTAGV